MTTRTPLLSFVVVNHNGGDLLARCLAAIADQSLRDFDVLVFDNGSTDDSLRCNEVHDARVRLLRADTNLGFAEANNRAIAATSGRYVALVNNDARLEPDWAAAMVAALEADPRAGAAAGKTLQAARPDLIDAAGFAFFGCSTCFCWRGAPAASLDGANHRPFGAVASAAVYRRAALADVGLFHPEYFCYYEDTDLAVRLVLHGYRTVYVDQAVAHHVGSYTGKERSAFHVYHLRRNAEYVFWCDMVGHLAWMNLPWHLTFEALVFGRAVIDGQGSVVLRAKLDALRRWRWIASERWRLTSALQARGSLRDGQRAMWAKMRLGLPWARLLA